MPDNFSINREPNLCVRCIESLCKSKRFIFKVQSNLMKNVSRRPCVLVLKYKELRRCQLFPNNTINEIVYIFEKPLKPPSKFLYWWNLICIWEENGEGVCNLQILTVLTYTEWMNGGVRKFLWDDKKNLRTTGNYFLSVPVTSLYFLSLTACGF